jgi:serine/threonine protein kinase
MNLLEYLQSNPNLSIHDKLHIAFQLMEGIKYLQDRGVVHNDLRLETVLVAPAMQYPFVKIKLGGLFNIT